MKKVALAVPVVFAAALALSACAKPADDANVSVLNDSISDDAGLADGNVTDGPAVDLNATDTNPTNAPGNAL